MKREIKVVKYEALKQSLTSPSDLPFDDDAATAFYRSIRPIGLIHAERVRNPLAMDTMLEVIEDLRVCIESRKKLVI